MKRLTLAARSNVAAGLSCLLQVSVRRRPFACLISGMIGSSQARHPTCHQHFNEGSSMASMDLSCHTRAQYLDISLRITVVIGPLGKISSLGGSLGRRNYADERDGNE